MSKYREDLRKKLGLDAKPVKEEAPVAGDEVAKVDPTAAVAAGVAGEPAEEAKEQVSPEAEAILTEILQFIDEKEKEAGDSATKLMLKSLYLHLSKNKVKILQKMADDSQ
jgi:hypothetical protein